MIYGIWILLALLVILGVPFLFYMDLKVQGSIYLLRLSFFRLKVWEKSNSPKQGNSKQEESPSEFGSSEANSTVPSSSPSQDPEIKPEESSLDTKDKPESPSTPSSPSSSTAPPAPTLPRTSIAAKTSPENITQSVKVESENDSSPSPELISDTEKPEPAISPWKIRLIRAVVNLKFLKALHEWSWSQLSLLKKIFWPSLHSLQFEFRTTDPLLLARVTQVSLLLKPILPMSQVTTLYGPSAWLVKARLNKRFHLAQFIYLGLRTIFGLPWMTLWRQWRLAKNGPLEKWEEKLVQMILQQMK